LAFFIPNTATSATAILLLSNYTSEVYTDNLVIFKLLDSSYLNILVMLLILLKFSIWPFMNFKLKVYKLLNTSTLISLNFQYFLFLQLLVFGLLKKNFFNIPNITVYSISFVNLVLVTRSFKSTSLQEFLVIASFTSLAVLLPLSTSI